MFNILYSNHSEPASVNCLGLFVLALAEKYRYFAQDMNNSAKEHVFSSLRKLLEPIIKMMLRNSLTFKEFSIFCKQIFVEVAARDFGLQGRPTNVSRISLLTGIDRKEVKRIKDLLQENKLVGQALQSQDRLTRVLSGWYQDSEFLAETGEPVPIPLEGDYQSFASLARKYGGNIPSGALLKELVRGQAVETLPDGTLRVCKRHFFPAQQDPEALMRASGVIHDLGSTLFHNLYVSDIEQGIPFRFERRASNKNIDPTQIEAFHAFVEREGQAFLERVDDWLSAHELEESDALVRGVRLGVGTYIIEERAKAVSTREQKPKPRIKTET